MDARAFLEALRADVDVDERLIHLEALPAREPALEPPPELPHPIPARLSNLGIDGLYPHQRRGLDLLSEGRNVVVATGTASGKTLIYNLHFARTALEEQRCTALYLFPTKALAR